MPLDPLQVNTSIGHPKANDVLLARVVQGGASSRPKMLEICNKLAISEDDYRAIIGNTYFKRFFQRLKYEKRFKDEIAGELSHKFAGQLAEQIAENSLDLRKLFDQYSPEALEKLVKVMRTAPYFRDQANAAVEILDRAGYVKIQKQLTVHADAEAIIRELNRQAQAPREIDITPEKQVEVVKPAQE